MGTDSPEEFKADPDVVPPRFPDARISLLEGETHLAHLTAPEAFAERVLSFLRH